MPDFSIKGHEVGGGGNIPNLSICFTSTIFQRLKDGRSRFIYSRE